MKPPAIAWPVTAATTGRSNAYQPPNSRLIPSTIFRWPSASRVGASFRSTPALKQPSRPAITTAPGGSARRSSRIAAPSASSWWSRAFTGGRSTFRTDTSPFCSRLRYS